MNVLIIGSKGFIGSNFKQYLIQKNFLNILDHNRKDSINNLLKKLKLSDLILHFGGENRSKSKVNFFKNNYELTKLVAINAKEKTQIIYTSTIKINEKNPYGLSKKKAEKILKKYKNKNNYKLSILRLPNVFGRWSKPNYNSVVSTYCYNAARKKSSLINDKKKELKLLYIDDLMEQLIDIIKSKKNKLYPTIKNINKIKDYSEYTNSNIRDGRDKENNLNYLNGADKIKEIENCEVINLKDNLNKVEKLKNLL